MNWNVLLSGVALSISVLSAGFAVALATILRRDPPDVAEVKSRLLALDQEVTDVNDRLGQWMRREAVRNMRAGKELANENAPAMVPDKKAELRRRAMQRSVRE